MTEAKGTPDRDVIIGTVVREGSEREGGVTAAEVAEVLTAEGYDLSPEASEAALKELAEAGDIHETFGKYRGV